jgi:ABC-type polysaccharide/polyol phosphate export permease
LQVLFFISPIIWMPDQVRGGQWALALNPMNYLIAIFRDPMLGRPVDATVWGGATLIVAVTLIIAIFAYSRYRRRVVFWV